jgi:hypothetical protein
MGLTRVRELECVYLQISAQVTERGTVTNEEFRQKRNGFYFPRGMEFME